MKRICFVTTSPLIVNFFLAPQLLSLRARYEMTLVVNTGEGVPLVPLPGVDVVSLDLQRRWSPFSDLSAVVRLVSLFARRHFDLVHSFSPKAGLLTMLAARLAGVPRRVHTFTGQIWVTGSWPKRVLLKSADLSIARLATHLLADSPSQRDFLIAHKVVTAGRSHVLGSGSISGVDARRFRPDHEARLDVRAELSIPADAQVILFLGRLKKEKGVSELAAAFARLAAGHRDVHLLLVGPDEESLLEGVLETCAPFADRVRNVGYTFTPERYIAASEILALPSHREGFGSVIIEAAAAGVPAVASRIYGISDAIVDETTGLMHEAANPVDLARQLERLLADEVLRVKLGTQARERALREFTQQRVCELIAAFYQDILQ